MLYDNDYNQWIPLAQMSSLKQILIQVFNPILSDWNIQFRPFQVLIFKGLFELFGYEPSGYFYFKSLLLALFSIVYLFFMRKYLQSTTIAILSVFLLAMSSSTFTSLYWMSDFVIVSEFLTLIVFVLFLNLENKKNHRNKFTVIITLVLILILTIIADRTKANAKLIPAIIFIYIIIVDWRKLKRYGIVLAMMIISVLPIKVMLTNPIPPFIHADPSTISKLSWQPVSLNKFWLLFARDFEFFSLLYPGYPPISILAIIGFPLVYMVVISIAILFYKYLKKKNIFLLNEYGVENYQMESIKKNIVFISIWALVNIIALASYPSLPKHFQARYAISVLIPLIPLLLILVYSAMRFLLISKKHLVLIFISLLLIIQLPFNVYHTFRMRNDYPTYIIAKEKLEDHVASKFKNSIFGYFWLPDINFVKAGESNEFIYIANPHATSIFIKELSKRSDSPAYFYLISLYKVPFGKLYKSFPGKSDDLFDRIFNSGENTYYRYTLYLYQFKLR